MTEEKRLPLKSDEWYDVVFDRFVKSTPEDEKKDGKTHHMLMKKKVEEIVGERKNVRFLDIGSGDGFLVGMIAELNAFSEISMVEPNKKFVKKLEKLKENNPIMYIYEDYFCNAVEKLKKENKEFDVILSSHVLYHLAPADWKKEIEGYISLLAKDGILIITMDKKGSDLHKYKLNFDPNYRGCIMEATKEAVERGDIVFVEEIKDNKFSPHTCVCEKEEDMWFLTSFFAMDVYREDEDTYNRRKEEERNTNLEKIEMLTKKMKSDVDGKYRLVWKQEMAVIRKLDKPRKEEEDEGEVEEEKKE